MAKLDPKPYPLEKSWNETLEGQPFMLRWTPEELQAHDETVWQKLHAAAAKLAPGEVVGAVLTFPVGDGQAIYIVTKAKPLTLQHVPLGDAYCIPGAHLRGIGVQEVRSQIAQSKRMAKRVARVG